jgi:hypothetical protein
MLAYGVDAVQFEMSWVSVGGPVPVQPAQDPVDQNDIDADGRHVVNGELCGASLSRTLTTE